MVHTCKAARQWQGHAQHGSMAEHGAERGRAWQGRAWQSVAESTLDCRGKKRTASQSKRRREQAATRRAEGKDVSSARAWPNLRNFGHRRCNLQGVGDGLDSCEISHKLRLLISIAVIAIWLLMAPDTVQREVQLQAYAKGWSLS